MLLCGLFKRSTLFVCNSSEPKQRLMHWKSDDVGIRVEKLAFEKEFNAQLAG